MRQLLNFEREAEKFLKSSIEQRLFVLTEYGLLRYRKLLTQIQLSEDNISCVAQFLHYPSQIKFPQLMGADLRGLSLDGVNFIRANLMGANLTGCCFRDADLLFGNFSRSNLTDANLRGATLNETIWTQTIVYNCDFRGSIGLTLAQVQYLRSHGGIFD
jgi:uncharacterized protein YjbI with pentapeptide repeats